MKLTKKSVYSKTGALLWGLLILLGMSCNSIFQHHISKGQSIKAKGFVIDTVKHKRLAGVKIYLMGGYNYEDVNSGGWDWNITVDSAITDANGNFAFNDVAEGKSEDYALSIDNFIRTNGAGVTSDEYPVYPFNSNGSSPIITEHKVYELNNKIIYARELNYARIHMKMLYNVLDTLDCRVYNYSQADVYFFVIGKRIDTTILLKCLKPGEKNFIYYGVTDYWTIHGIDSEFHQLDIEDSLFPHISDTLSIERTIAPIYRVSKRHEL
jgi:hypothetical protein